jgi:N-acetylmuramoyl-L-alanine amidase
LLLLALLAAAPALAARITAISLVPGELVLQSDAPVPVAQSFALADPSRLVVDLVAVVDGALVAPGVNSVAGVRLAMFAPGTARLVIDLNGPVIITGARGAGNSITILLKRATAAEFAASVARGRKPLAIIRSDAAPPPPTLPSDGFTLPAGIGKPPASAPPMTPPAAATPPPAASDTPPPGSEAPAPAALKPATAAPGVKPRSGGKPLVVIDAGHGGKDVGAISVSGGYEKDVTLAIAQLTAERLQKNGRVRVRLTRDSDFFIPLGGRVRIARTARADLFMSIHADSAPNDQARGASVYTLSAVASDAIAERLAARENKADIIGGVNLGVEAPDVGDIMADLVRRATGNVSVAFAEVLQDALEDKIRFRGEFHHFAAFAVLKAPDVPSVLLETGYVTNEDDADLLFSDKGRRKIADGIAAAIERHLLGDAKLAKR